jgi:osmotically inducible protein OsmC
MQVFYTAIVHATGGGRDGRVRSDDDRLDLETRPPKEMGGSGEGTNPEQLFAAGYAACFLSAIHVVGATQKLDTSQASVSASVGLVSPSDGTYGLTVALDVYLPAVAVPLRQGLMDAAHAVCPYSNATRANLDVVLTLVN